MKFVKTDGYNFVKNFFLNDMFFNVFLYGPKGCGKTKTIEKIHLELNKKLVRVNVTVETDEDSLIGGFRLKNGETKFEKGPIIVAMEEGATLLLDEIDQGHPQRLMCLQSILEGSGYHIKRTNEYIEPKEGFKIIATANTKGGGDETGQYIGAQILNSALKDRFSIFYAFNYPSPDIEKSILTEIRDDLKNSYFKYSQYAFLDDDVKKLVSWAEKVRSNDGDYSIDESISTRKLIDIVKSFYYIGDLKLAMKLAISGLNDEYVEAFMKLYDLISDDGTFVDPTPKKTYTKF